MIGSKAGEIKLLGIDKKRLAGGCKFIGAGPSSIVAFHGFKQRFGASSEFLKMEWKMEFST